MRSVITSMAAGALALAGAAASAQGFPAKPIRMIVTFPPGSGTDIVARLVGQKMSEDLGQPVVVDNRPGAGGSIGAALAAKAPADGHTIVMVSAAHTINPNVFKKLPFDPVADFAPITMLSSTPYLLLAHPSLPVRSVEDLVRLAKERPGELNYASGGVAVGSHLAGELFRIKAGIDLRNVPYKGAAQATADVVAGQVHLSFSTMPSALPLVRAKKVRALGVTTADRVKAMPEFPAIAETVPGIDVRTWQGLLAPGGTPAAIVDRLYQSTAKALARDDVHQRLVSQAYEPAGNTPQAFAEQIKREIGMWKDVVVAAKIPPM